MRVEAGFEAVDTVAVMVRHPATAERLLPWQPQRNLHRHPRVKRELVHRELMKPSLVVRNLGLRSTVVIVGVAGEGVGEEIPTTKAAEGGSQGGLLLSFPEEEDEGWLIRHGSEKVI